MRLAPILGFILAALIARTALADGGNTAAIVIQDQIPLRAAARDSAQQQAVLWQGDALEVRGQRMDYLQVYDHRRERAGYVRASQVRLLPLQADNAADLLAVVHFLRDTPGAEALGIGYAAAYLKAAPAAAIGADAFDALGTMADRLARRASSHHAKADDAVIAAHLEVAASYGVVIKSFEHDGRMQLCYDGEAFRRVMALKASDEEKARAALALTRQECIDPDLTPVNRASLDTWRADVLERAPRLNLPEHIKNRLRLRNAGVWASIAFERVRRGEPAQEAAELAIAELASVNKERLVRRRRLRVCRCGRARGRLALGGGTGASERDWPGCSRQCRRARTDLHQARRQETRTGRAVGAALHIRHCLDQLGRDQSKRHSRRTRRAAAR